MFFVFVDVPQTSDWLALFCCGFAFVFLSDVPEAERERKEEAKGEWALYVHQRKTKQKRSGYRVGVAGRARQGKITQHTRQKKAKHKQTTTKKRRPTCNASAHRRAYHRTR